MIRSQRRFQKDNSEVKLSDVLYAMSKPIVEEGVKSKRHRSNGWKTRSFKPAEGSALD